MTPTPPTTDPCLDVIVEIELAADGLNSADRGAVIRDAVARHPRCAAAILAHFHLVALNRQPTPPSGHQFRAGDEVGGRYRIGRFVASGGMGEVYEATDLLLDRPVALKVIRPRVAADSDSAAARFHREGMVLADVHHTNVVPIHDTGEDRGVRFHALQYVRGITLHRALDAIRRDVLGAQSSASLRGLVGPLLESADQGRPAGATAAARRRFGRAHFTSLAEVLAQAADGLHHTHTRGYCHRDVKPSNVMLDTDGVCWLIDFGLAGSTATGQVLGETTGGPEVTRGPLGTPAFMAPEQFDARADARTDVWGLGVILYEFLTLRRPFPGTTFAELEPQVRNDHPVPPRRVVREVPADLEAICLKALAKDPAHRYQTTAAMADDLRRWLTWRPTGVRPGWLTLRPLRLWAWRHQGLSLALLLMVALVGIACGWAYQRGEQQLAEASAQAERQRREVAFLKVQEEVTTFRRLGHGHVGWPDELSRLLDEMQGLQPEARLRNLRATTLIGLDCRLEFTYSVPQSQGQRRGFSDVTFSPSGKGIAVGGLRDPRSPPAEHTAATAWRDGHTGGPVVASEVGNGPVAFLDDQTPLQLIEPTRDRPTVRLWDLAANRPAAEVSAPGKVAATAVAPGGRLFAVGGSTDEGGVTVVWEYHPALSSSAREVARFEGAASALAFSADGRFLAVGTPVGGVTVHSLFDERAAVALPNVRLVVNSLAFGRGFTRGSDGQPRGVPGGLPGLQLAVGTSSGRLHVFDLGTRAEATVAHDFSHFLNALAFSPDGTTLVVAGHRHPVLIDVATGRVRFEFSGVPFSGRQAYTGAAFSPDGRRLALTGYAMYGNGQGGVDVFALDDGRGVRTYHGLSGWVEKSCLSKSRKWVAGFSQQWQVAVWERETGRLAYVWDVPPGRWADNATLTFDAAETSVYVAGGRHISRYCLNSGKRLGSWEVEDGLNDALLARADGQVWSLRREGWADGPGEIALRKLVADGRTEPVTPLPPRPTGGIHLVKSSSDGTEVVFKTTVDGAERLVVWEVGDGEVRVRPPSADNGHAAGLVSFPVGPHGLSFTEPGQSEPTLFDLGNEATSSSGDAITPDGRLVHWGRRDGTVLVADVERCRKALEKFPR